MSKALLLVGLRQPKESLKAVRACNDYLRMPNRSVARLHASYLKRANPPSKGKKTLEKWCRVFKWVERAERYDQERETALIAAQVEELNSGIATPVGRVKEMKQLFHELRQLLTDGDVFLERTKVYDGEIVARDKVYNSSLVSDLRGLLDDLAKETGGRQRSVTVQHTPLSDRKADDTVRLSF